MIQQKCWGLSVREQMKVIAGHQLLEKKTRWTAEEVGVEEGLEEEEVNVAHWSSLYADTRVSHTVGLLVIGRAITCSRRQLCWKGPIVWNQAAV